MFTGLDVDPQRITRAMRNDLEALHSTAEMIEILAESADTRIRELQKFMEKDFHVRWGDWRVIYTFLTLLDQQVQIVKDTIERFESFDFTKQGASSAV